MNGWPSFRPISASSPPNDSRSRRRLVANLGEQVGNSIVERLTAVTLPRHLTQSPQILTPQRRIPRLTVQYPRHRPQSLHQSRVTVIQPPPGPQERKRLLQLPPVRRPPHPPPPDVQARK